MGIQISADTFDERDYARFRERLEQCLAELGRLLQQPGFGAGPVTIGAELECFLVDGATLPLPRNQAIRAAVADPRITLELSRFNLELNASPVPLAGRPFAALGDELDLLLGRVGDAARAHQGRIALIGILPTLAEAHLHPGVITDAPRYRALDRGLVRLRRGPAQIRIAGDEPLDIAIRHVAPEGANTSFQVHLRVAPEDFARTYNAAQLASAPVLAVAGNSPTFLGHRLWEETRIALFKQAVEDRRAGPRRGPSRTMLGTGWLRSGALELFTESVRLHEPLLPAIADREPAHPGEQQPPPLDELRLHQGTVWPWNRAIYDPAAGGHLRIEMRFLPAGPTVTDMMANAAFMIGLTRWLAGQDQRWTYALPFERADHGFYRAAQYGLAAELSWPLHPPRARGGRRGVQVRTLAAADLVAELIPAARLGLLQAGVTTAEADRLLGVIAARLATGQTGAAWQRAALAAAAAGRSRERALAVMLDQYLACAATGQPVHTWPLGR
ncbi:MAG TPA: glutamate--cysteine ligase [Streptosporangiaceae bacterium]|nr:glutamate--cysteine ligase [Streptosporangiaceae bacterium]